MRTDVLIVGGGPAGATSAMCLAAEGIRPMIVEREPFPRYHIGESMTGECGAVLRDLGLEHTMLAVYQQKYHWAWFIPLDEGVVSVGVVVPAAYFLDKKETTQAFLLRELHELNPDLKRRLPDVTFAEDVHVIPNYSFQVRQFCGKGFICVGDAHRFIDPIFSFGLYVSMKEAQLAAPLVKAYLAGAQRDIDNPFAAYQLRCEKGIDVLEDTIDLFWEQPFAFAAFVHARYREYFTDILAGRIYERQPSPAVTAVRKMLQREEERNRSYEAEDRYSMPIGSRFHPERSALWESNAPVESTEAWMGPR